MIRDILGLLSILDKKFKKKFIYLLFFFFINFFFQFFFLTSIVFVISVLVDSSLIFENKYFLYIYNLAFDSEVQFINFMILISLILVVVSSASNLLNNFLICKFANYISVHIENIFFNLYINENYNFFNKNSQNRLISKLKDNINIFSIRLFPYIFVFFSALATLLAIIIILLYVDFTTTITIFILLIACYYFFYVYLKSKIKILSELNAKYFLKKTEFIINTFKNLKVLKFLPKNNFKNIHFSNSISLAKNSIKLFIMESSPRVFMEFILYAGSLFLIFYFYQADNRVLDITKIVFFGLASSKALPSINQIFSSIVQLKSSVAYIDSFKDEIELIKKNKNSPMISQDKFIFKDKIKLSNVGFKYQEDNSFNINDLNLVIKKNNIYGFCGKSGSGKTTIIDLISGIYLPHIGSLSIDKTPLDEKRIDDYKKIISYVPQEFYIGDNTIKESIIFGSDIFNKENFDFAVKYSSIDEFVDNLPQKFDTLIGDRGVNLSLGQKQRISLARALYKKPSILILDEATNSLDNLNESKILNGLKELKLQMTIIFISHKVSSMDICDYIFLIKNGKIDSEGSFDYLKNSSEYFNLLKS